MKTKRPGMPVFYIDYVMAFRCLLLFLMFTLIETSAVGISNLMYILYDFLAF